MVVCVIYHLTVKNWLTVIIIEAKLKGNIMSIVRIETLENTVNTLTEALRKAHARLDALESKKAAAPAKTKKAK